MYLSICDSVPKINAIEVIGLDWIGDLFLSPVVELCIKADHGNLHVDEFSARSVSACSFL